MPKKTSIKTSFTDITSDIADEFYPKGDARRGEFIRDQALIYTRFRPIIDKRLAEAKETPIALKVTLLSEAVLKYFEDEKSGIFSDIAYYELIEQTEAFIKSHDGPPYIKYLEFCFGIETQQEFQAVLKEYRRGLGKWEKALTVS